MLKVSTVNVNGLRAAAGKGFTAWLGACGADVVCLQEVRAEPGRLTDAVREPEGWHTVYAPSVLKTGDSIYFDSKMAHALISLSDEAAEVLWVCEN